MSALHSERALHAERAIDRYFRGELTSSSAREAMFDHLGSCTSCRTHFDNVAWALRALESQSPIFSDAQNRSTGIETGQEVLSEHEIDLIGANILDEMGTSKRTGLRRTLAVLGGVLIPCAATVLFVFAPPNRGELTAKGHPNIAASAPKAVIEALCFDEDAKIIKHLATSGSCPAPGFLKILYASPRTVDTMTVAVLENDRVVFQSTLERPEPRSVVPAHAKVSKNSVLKIIAVEGEVSKLEELRMMTPTIVVEGASAERSTQLESQPERKHEREDPRLIKQASGARP